MFVTNKNCFLSSSKFSTDNFLKNLKLPNCIDFGATPSLVEDTRDFPEDFPRRFSTFYKFQIGRKVVGSRGVQRIVLFRTFCFTPIWRQSVSRCSLLSSCNSFKRRLPPELSAPFFRETYFSSSYTCAFRLFPPPPRQWKHPTRYFSRTTFPAWINWTY